MVRSGIDQSSPFLPRSHTLGRLGFGSQPCAWQRVKIRCGGATGRWEKEKPSPALCGGLQPVRGSFTERSFVVGSGLQPAMVRAQAPACAVSVMAGDSGAARPRPRTRRFAGRRRRQIGYPLSVRRQRIAAASGIAVEWHDTFPYRIELRRRWDASPPAPPLPRDGG